MRDMAGRTPDAAAVGGPPEFDLLDAEVQVHPFAAYATMRARGPVEILDPEATSPTFVVSHHEEARAVLGDPARFSSRLLPLPALLFLDPPDHDRIRRTVSRAFTARAVAGLGDRITEIATDLTDRYVAAGGGDLVAAVSGRLPVYVIGQVLGVPTGDWEQLRHWSEDSVRALSAVGSGGEEAQSALAGAMALHQRLGEVAEDHAARHATDPADTIAGRLAAAEAGGELDRAELVGFLQLLFVAGHETTTALITHTAELLAHAPELQRAVRADRSLVVPLIEEVLRTSGPLQRLFRIATVDTELGGVAIPKGATVVVLIGSANRDAARFTAGDAIDLDRAETNHLAFGHGIHHCLGAPLARLEARIAVERLLDRTETIEPDPDETPVRFTGGTTSELQTTRLPLVVGRSAEDQPPRPAQPGP